MAHIPPEPELPPLGAWWRVYLLVAVLAIGVMLVLWWFTAACNIRLGVK